MPSKMPYLDFDVYACLKCGYCREVCPTFEQYGWESVSPRGKIFYLKLLKEKNPLDLLLGMKIDIYDNFVESIYKCTTCAACKEVCHVKIDLVKLFEELREWMVRNKRGPLSKHKASYLFITTKHNPFNEDPELRTNWLPKDIELSKNPEVLFFPGCTSSYRMYELAISGVKILQKLKIPFTILGKDEWCCGSVLLRTGQTNAIVKLVEHNINAIEGRGVKTVITTCSGCYNTIKNDYPKYLGKLGFEIMHISQFLLKQINERKLKLKKLNKKITYHDPCHLGRHAKVYDEPRELLKELGCELIEMKRIKTLSRCCGAGGGFKAQFPEKALAIAVDRVKEAERTNAEILTTMCPFCKLNLTEGVKKANLNMEVKDTSELVLEAME